MPKTLVTKIVEQENDFNLITQHLKYYCKVYLAGNISQMTLISVTKLDLLKMKLTSEKLLKNLLKVINGKTGNIY
ncbi:MAG: hypothetical protein A2167_08695 [Planctomycetes bacterium RBG_13_46_10]|nr:MAG: hypothetical protein A2167_08695 [Planctomycetes bacterium RBG_13_46_10]